MIFTYQINKIEKLEYLMPVRGRPHSSVIRFAHSASVGQGLAGSDRSVSRMLMAAPPALVLLV